MPHIAMLRCWILLEMTLLLFVMLSHHYYFGEAQILPPLLSGGQIMRKVVHSGDASNVIKLRAVSHSNTSITLAWDPQVDEVDVRELVWFTSVGPSTIRSSTRLTPSTSNYTLNSLTPSTSYSFQLLSFVSNYTRATETSVVNATTLLAGQQLRCDCWIPGSVVVAHEVQCYAEQCWCREHHVGRRCADCQPNYYMYLEADIWLTSSTSPSSPPNARDGTCTTCPCLLKASTGTCHLDSRDVKCDVCVPGYAGDLCNECTWNHHIVRTSSGEEVCSPCSCYDNLSSLPHHHHHHHQVAAHHQCEDLTGRCLLCPNSTQGDHCEVCAPGYYGNPMHRQACALDKGVNSPSLLTHTSLLVGILVGISLPIILTLVYIVYRKFGAGNKMVLSTLPLLPTSRMWGGRVVLPSLRTPRTWGGWSSEGDGGESSGWMRGSRGYHAVIGDEEEEVDTEMAKVGGEEVRGSEGERGEGSGGREWGLNPKYGKNYGYRAMNT